MSFTLGHEESYDAALAKGPVRKTGRMPPGSFDDEEDYPGGYPGGWVFHSLEEARVAGAKRGFAVYLLGGTFTASRRHDRELHLNCDADVVRKVKGPR